MRPGDYITVNPTEVEVLRSDAFKRVVPDDVAREIRLTAAQGDPEGYECLSLPKIGRPVADALRRLAATGPSTEAVVAEHLAERIEHRLDHRPGAR